MRNQDKNKAEKTINEMFEGLINKVENKELVENIKADVVSLFEESFGEMPDFENNNKGELKQTLKNMGGVV